MKYLLLIVFSCVVSNIQAIEKCQDESGKWHYGDAAGAECENTQVTIMNDLGTVTDQVEAPKTAEELKAAAQAEAILQAAEDKEQAERDEKLRILSIYETEADIDRLRDNQLHSVQGNIDVHKAYLKSMDRRIARYQEDIAEAKSEPAKQQLQKQIDQANKRIKDSTNELAELKVNKIQIVERFAKEKEVYLRLKNIDQPVD